MITMNSEQILENEKVRLRALEPEDLDLLYEWENNTTVWESGSTIAPFSKKILKDYIDNSHLDIYEAKQLRLMIDERSSGKTIGAIDLYDFDARNRRAGIGIYVVEEFQRKGYALNALQVLLTYCSSMLLMHQLYVEVQVDNKASLSLFQKAGFSIVGAKKDWLIRKNGFVDVILMQKIF